MKGKTTAPHHEICYERDEMREQQKEEKNPTKKKQPKHKLFSNRNENWWLLHTTIVLALCRSTSQMKNEKFSSHNCFTIDRVQIMWLKCLKKERKIKCVSRFLLVVHKRAQSLACSPIHTCVATFFSLFVQLKARCFSSYFWPLPFLQRILYLRWMCLRLCVRIFFRFSITFFHLVRTGAVSFSADGIAFWGFSHIIHGTWLYSVLAITMPHFSWLRSNFNAIFEIV